MKEVKVLCNENYILLKNESKKITEDGKISHVHRLAESMS
jgi:hypothetical protein